MRHIILSILIISSLWAIEPKNNLGIGTAISESPYHGVDNDPLPFPMVTYHSDTFYIQALEIGYKIVNVKMLKFNAIINPVLRNLDPDDSQYLNGMEKRDRTIDAGFKLAIKPIPLISFSAKALHDTLGVHEGYRTELKASVLIPFNKSFIIMLNHARQKYSSDYINYYFGVKANEATASRSEYIPASSNISATGVNFIYNITDKVQTNLGITRNKLGDEIKNSPIVDKDETTSYFLSLTYKI